LPVRVGVVDCPGDAVVTARSVGAATWTGAGVLSTTLPAGLSMPSKVLSTGVAVYFQSPVGSDVSVHVRGLSPPSARGAHVPARTTVPFLAGVALSA
jgi:hypothetical protein